jgi:trehalose/maltose hydrolase-like predicted phosphorylase
MPPDENQVDVDNSIYTNAVANLAVSTARWTTCLAEGSASAANKVPNEWLDKVFNLTFVYNEEKRYHEEFEGFDELLTNGRTRTISRRNQYFFLFHMKNVT